MKETRSSGVAVRYVDNGRSGPAYLMLPGWCGSRAMFDRLIPVLGEHHRTIAMDWRGHGASERPEADFGSNELVSDAAAVIEASGAESVIPVAVAHAGWVALELCRKMRHRIPRVVSIEWFVLDPPPQFLGALHTLQHPEHWRETRDALFRMWLDGVTNPDEIRYVREDMGSYGFEMWARAGREIARAYERHRNPLQAFAALSEPPRLLHVYATPGEPAYLHAQESFAKKNVWFTVRRLNAHGHFPLFDVPEEIAGAILAKSS